MKKSSLAFGFLIGFLVLTGLLLFPAYALHAEEAAKGEGAKTEKAEGGDKKDKKDKKSSGDEEVSGGRFTGDPIYVHLRPIFVPVMSDKGADQIVTMLVDLQVADMSIANRFQENMPRVRDAIMQTLYGGFSNGTLRRGAAIDVPKIKSKIYDAIVKAMGEKSVQEVLVIQIAQRRM